MHARRRRFDTGAAAEDRDVVTARAQTVRDAGADERCAADELRQEERDDLGDSHRDGASSPRSAR